MDQNTGARTGDAEKRTTDILDSVKQSSTEQSKSGEPKKSVERTGARASDHGAVQATVSALQRRITELEH